MTVAKIPLEDASDEQLRDFATVTLQLDATGVTSRSDLLSLISLAWPQDFLLAEAAPEASAEQDQVVTARSEPITGGIGANDPIVELTIREDEKPGGKEPVPVAVNGRTLVIQRNLRVKLPYRFYLNLTNACYGEVTQDPATKEPVETQAPRYNVMVHKQPTEAEIAAWHERVDEEVMPA